MATVTTLSGKVYLLLDPLAIQSLISSPAGPIVRDLFVRGERVKIRAHEEAPVKTGNLRDHIVKRLVFAAGQPVMLVGVEGVPYALFVHEGTVAHDIYPVHAKALVFIGADGNLVFAKHVHHPGTRPNRFLVRALPAAA